MFWGIVSSVLSVLNTFAYRKAVLAGVAMGARPLFRTFFNNAVVLAILGAAVFFPKTFGIDFSPYVSEPSVFLLAVTASVAGIGSSLAGQYAYANERAGTLAPFSETGRLLTVVAGFFLFAGSSVGSFVSALVAIFALVAFSVDFRSFSMNRYCVVLAASGILRAVSALATGYVVTRVTPITLTLFDVAFAAAACLPVLVAKKGFPVFERSTFVPLVKWTAANDAIWIVTFVISLFLLKNLGIVVASLLGMISLVLTIALDAAFSKRLPDFRTSAVALVVSAAVVSGSLLS